MREKLVAFEGVGGENLVKIEWGRWCERAPVLLELCPLVVNQSWQHLSLTLSPICYCSPLIPLGPWHHGKICSPQTHISAHFCHHYTPPGSSHISSLSGTGLVYLGAQDKHGACGTNRPLMWTDRADNQKQCMLSVSIADPLQGWVGECMNSISTLSHSLL